MAKGIKDQCTECLKKVFKRSQALRCNKCGGCIHAKCAKISSALYLLIKESESVCVEIKCLACKLGNAAKFAGESAGEDGDNNPLDDTTLPATMECDITCLPAEALLMSSTPKDVSFTEELPTLVKNSIPRLIFPPIRSNAMSDTGKVKSYAAAAAELNHPATTSSPLVAPRKFPVDRKRQLTNNAATASQGLNSKVSRPTHQELVAYTSFPTVPPGKNRRQCLIIMNIPESNAETAQERVDHDVHFIRDCFQKLYTADEETIAKNIRPMNIYRLGKRLDEKTRPLKVVLSSEKDVGNILARTHRLKGLPARILRDLSPEDRIRLKEAINELREKRSNGDNNWIIRDFRVIRRRPRIKWHPLQLQAIPPALLRTELPLPQVYKNPNSSCIQTPAAL